MRETCKLKGEKGIDKSGMACYYVQAVREGSEKHRSEKKFEKT